MEKFLTGPNLIFLGLMIWSAMMLRNSAARSRRSRNRDVSRELKSELQKKERSAESQIHQLEVRLHDYDRDVAARVETTLTMLDQLIAEADREIVRLETLLEKRKGGKVSPLSPEQRRMVVHLAGAGYSIHEIAKLVDHSADQIAAILKADDQDQRAA